MEPEIPENALMVAGNFDSCDTVRTDLVALLDNELSETAAAAVRAHLGICSVCWQHFETLLQTVKTADAWVIEDADIWEALEKRLSSEPKERDAPIGGLHRQRTERTLLDQAFALAYPAELPPTADTASPDNADDLHAVLTEMRALRTEIQELRGEVGTLRRLLSAARSGAPVGPVRPLPPPPMMPLALSENSTIGLL